MEADDSSDLSSLSSLSPPPSDSESEVQLKEDTGILKFFHKLKGREEQSNQEPQPPTPRKREPSPPHEPVFADNPDIAVCSLPLSRVKAHLGRDVSRSKTSSAVLYPNTFC
jgi:hypothetical protein